MIIIMLVLMVKPVVLTVEVGKRDFMCKDWNLCFVHIMRQYAIDAAEGKMILFGSFSYFPLMIFFF